MKLPKPREYKSDKMKFENMIEDGENPLGYTGQTANGTTHWKGTGWNKSYGADYDMPQCEVEPTHPGGRSNRTGE